MILALKEKRVDWQDFDFEFVVGDIQELNEKAKQGLYEITAISVGAYPGLRDQYLLMPVGASVGDQFGPAIVVHPSSTLTLDQLAGRRIGVPGLNTSAHISAQALIGPFIPVPMYFMDIRDAVMSGEIEAGILIHELQLNPESQGLKKLSDLGILWYDRFQLPLPLGANAIRRDLGAATIERLSSIYRQSIEVGLASRGKTIASAVASAAAKATLDVTLGDQYISMYVNQRSLAFQIDTLAGIRQLFDLGAERGLFAPIRLDENISP